MSPRASSRCAPKRTVAHLCDVLRKLGYSCREPVFRWNASAQRELWSIVIMRPGSRAWLGDATLYFDPESCSSNIVGYSKDKEFPGEVRAALRDLGLYGT